MEKESRLAILFFTRRHRGDLNELHIYARVTCFGKRSDFSLNRTIPTNLWDGRNKRGRGSSKYVIALNKYLNNVHAKLFDSHNDLLFEGKEITAKAITNRYFGKDEKSRTLVQLIDYHNKTMEPVLRPGTMKNYRSSRKVLKRFLLEEYGAEDYPLTDFPLNDRTTKGVTRPALTLYYSERVLYLPSEH